MPALKHPLRLALLLLLANQAGAADWNSRLYGNRGEVTVHEDNRATIRQGDVERPLWNGTHRLQDGSTLIIRNGVAVPNLSIMESRQQLPPAEPEEWEGLQIVGTSPCERLARKVCGPENECAAAEPCQPTRQLVARERDERQASDNPNLMTPTSGQCLQAMQDKEFFLECRKTRQ
jgi:hypothetical protein